MATLISCWAQQAGSKLTVQHSSAFLHVNTLLGSSVPMDLFTGQSLMSSGSTVVVVVVDILGFIPLLSYLRSMQRLPTTKPFDACFTTTSFLCQWWQWFCVHFSVVLCSFFMFHWLVLKLFGGIYLSYQCSTSLALFNERTHCAPFFVASVLLWKGEKSFTKPQSSHYV